jgi:PhnB protein
MMSDGQGHDQLAKFDGFSLTLNVTAGEADKLFAGLSEGGKVHVPLCETFFAEKFGMCADKFGVSWLLLTAKKQE